MCLRFKGDLSTPIRVSLIVVPDNIFMVTPQRLCPGSLMYLLITETIKQDVFDVSTLADVPETEQ